MTLVTLQFLTASVSAQSTWTGAVDNAWTNTGNWSPASLPSQTAAITFDASGANQTVDLTGTTVVLSNGSAMNITGGAYVFTNSTIRFANTANAITNNFTGSGADQYIWSSIQLSNATGDANTVLFRSATNSAFSTYLNGVISGSGKIRLGQDVRETFVLGGSSVNTLSSGAVFLNRSTVVVDKTTQNAANNAFGTAGVFSLDNDGGKLEVRNFRASYVFGIFHKNGFTLQSTNGMFLGGGTMQSTLPGNSRINFDGTGTTTNALFTVKGNMGFNATNTTAQYQVNTIGSNTTVFLDSYVGYVGIGNGVNNTNAGGTTLLKMGSGVLRYRTGLTNPYSGSTILQDGTIELDNFANQLGFQANQSATGTLQFATNNSGGTGGVLLYTAAANETSARGFTVDTGVTTGGINVSNAAVALTMSGTNTGSGTFNKLGAGTLVLSGNGSARTGSTVVQAGSLIVDGSLGGTTIVNSGTVLGGSGTLGSATISGTHAPGNSPGIQTFTGDLTYDGANVQWELTANTTVQGSPTPVFDQIVVGGNLNFATPTTLSLSFNFTGSAVDWSNSLWSNNITGTSGWLLYDVAGTLSNFGNLSITTENWADVNGALFNTELAGSSFSLYQAGDDIYLNYAVPEPSTYAMLALAGVGLAAHAIRRRRRQS